MPAAVLNHRPWSRKRPARSTVAARADSRVPRSVKSFQRAIESSQPRLGLVEIGVHRLAASSRAGECGRAAIGTLMSRSPQGLKIVRLGRAADG